MIHGAECCTPALLIENLTASTPLARNEQPNCFQREEWSWMKDWRDGCVNRWRDDVRIFDSTSSTTARGHIRRGKQWVEAQVIAQLGSIRWCKSAAEYGTLGPADIRWAVGMFGGKCTLPFVASER